MVSKEIIVEYYLQNKSESLRAQLAERVQEVAQLREALTAAEGIERCFK